MTPFEGDYSMCLCSHCGRKKADLRSGVLLLSWSIVRLICFSQDNEDKEGLFGVAVKQQKTCF